MFDRTHCTHTDYQCAQSCVSSMMIDRNTPSDNWNIWTAVLWHDEICVFANDFCSNIFYHIDRTRISHQTYVCSDAVPGISTLRISYHSTGKCATFPWCERSARDAFVRFGWKTILHRKCIWIFVDRYAVSCVVAALLCLPILRLQILKIDNTMWRFPRSRSGHIPQWLQDSRLPLSWYSICFLNKCFRTNDSPQVWHSRLEGKEINLMNRTQNGNNCVVVIALNRQLSYQQVSLHSTKVNDLFKISDEWNSSNRPWIVHYNYGLG